jgi:hypothetical protein
MTPPILGQFGFFTAVSVAGLSLIPSPGGVLSIGPAEGAIVRGVLSVARQTRPQSELTTAYAAGGEYVLCTLREGGATVGGATNVVQQIQQAGGVVNIPTAALLPMLQDGINQSSVLYRTAQGRRGPIRASDMVTRTLSDSAIATDSRKAFLARRRASDQAVAQMVTELLQRGVSYEQIGQLPLNFNPAFQSLDMPIPWDAYYAPQAARWETEFPTIFGNTMGFSSSQVLPAINMYGYGPEDAGSQFNTVTAAYGGPIWTYLARLRVDPSGLIATHFDPWRAFRSMTPAQVAAYIAPALSQAARVQAQQYQNFTSGGP